MESREDTYLLDPPLRGLSVKVRGGAGLLRSELEAAAALVFAQTLPGGAEPGTDDSRSYTEWLGQWPGAKSDADT
jgi:hypothetical protein